MIQTAFITEWRNKAPWPQGVQIEQDLIITFHSFAASACWSSRYPFRSGWSAA
jgi:hypothetical protein